VTARLLTFLLCVVLVVACAPPKIDRPLEGAPVVEGRPTGDANSVPPTLSPPTPPGAANASPDASGSPAPGSPSPPSPSPVAEGGYVIVATDGAGANLRTGPSTSASVVTTLAEGTAVEVLGEPVTVEGRAWRQIRSGTRQGWVVAVVVRKR
jgi:hypothetical protein